MKIKNIKINNFKSFSNLDINLNNLNVLIGANGSGKSNFILAIKFLKDLLNYSLETAIINQGGSEYLKNMYLYDDTDTFKAAFQLELKNDVSINCNYCDPSFKFELVNITSEFALKISEDDFDYHVISDKLSLVFEKSSLKDDELETSNIELNIFLDNNSYSYSSENIELINKVFPKLKTFLEKSYNNKSIILSPGLFFSLGLKHTEIITSNIAIYVFEQNLITSVKTLPYDDSENDNDDVFIHILDGILSNLESKRTLFNLLDYVLPSIEDIKVVKSKNQSNRIMIKEKFNKNYIPSSFISDGTVFLLIIIISLYFDNRTITIFDEPERRIHPHLLSKIMDMIKDVSNHKQIILSTHNPEIVRNTGLENLIIVKRNLNGNSYMTNASELKEINTFVNNEIGIDELFIQNLLS